MQRIHVLQRVIPRVGGTRTLSRTFMASGQRQANNPVDGKSHATDESVVPEPVQKAAPETLEKALPEGVHPTKGSDIDPHNKETSWKSHATGPSIVPEFVQKAAPEALEKALPESVHPTKGSDIDPHPGQKTGMQKNTKS
ncbi:uncharacterized protein Z520_05521 [Fonsecaea multimorphosa CBS 102226]|uniref:Uncharacterized protein n=1 Tax=Fonsecaea multimorphosa CBS 102226 TaxID=1442371 RepID=A0A0D2HAY3_9EURO|nr:uncharacterized protein Z520_05521 [Fonsecaea multimorphosa CBS 102226]KIX99060.1 hypothetical protein Z520_05521 [Fonsecaea multimorphosa CBS 102226]OAL25324.1 hypothetical protein AYO22_05201 [Fonsecaea multimorphosa]